MRRFFAVVAVLLLAIVPIAMAEQTGANANNNVPDPLRMIRPLNTTAINIDAAKLKIARDYITANVKDPALKALGAEGKNGSDFFNALSLKVGQMKAADLSARVQRLTPVEKMKMAGVRVNFEGLRLADKITEFGKNNAEALAACQTEVDALQAAAAVAATNKDLLAAVDDTDLKTIAKSNTTSSAITVSAAKLELQEFRTLWQTAAKCLLAHRVDNALTNHKTALDNHIQALNQVDFTKVDAALAKLETGGANADLVAKIKATVTALKDEQAKLKTEGTKLVDAYATVNTSSATAVQKAKWIAQTNKFNQLVNAFLVRLKNTYKHIVHATTLAATPTTSTADITQASSDLTQDTTSAQADDPATEIASVTADPSVQSAVDATATATADTGDEAA